MRNAHKRFVASGLLALSLLLGGAQMLPTLAQQTPVSVAQTTAASGLRLTFPTPGKIYARIPAITGEVTDASLQIAKVYVRVYDQTTGKYYNGTAFASSTPVELLAYGNREWILETPGAFDNTHVFIIGVRGETADGKSIDFADRFNFGVDAKAPTAQTPPENLGPDEGLLDRLIASAKADRDRALEAYIDSITRSGGIPLSATLGTTGPLSGTGSVAVTDSGSQTPTAVMTTVTTETITRSAAPETGSGSTVATCPYTPEQFIRENSITSLLKETCKDPRILSSTLNLSPEENYNIKYEEYNDRGLLRDLPTGALNTVGLRDSDQDGLADKAELAIGTDPFYHDTDQDTSSDGEEVLNHGSDPRSKESTPSSEGLIITNIKDGMRTKDPRPLVVGNGKPGANVRLYEMKDGRPEMLIGEDTTDEGGTFMIEPFLDLAEGDHRVAVLYADNSGQSQTVYFIIDSSLNVPPPDVTKITSTKMKPQVYGTTVFGSTVIGHFRSRLSTSAVISDTPTGEFVVTSARALTPGSHKAILYATLPNNVRSEKVTIPFTMAADGSILLDTFPYWWILGGAALLLLVMMGARMLRKKNLVLFSIDRRELAELEKTNRIGQLTWETRQPLTLADLHVRYIGFYLNTWAEDEKSVLVLKDFAKVKPGTLITVLDIEEMYLIPEGGGEPIDVLYGKELPKSVTGYTLRYVVNMPKELLSKYFPVFDGKKLVELAQVEHYTGKLSATLKAQKKEEL